MTKPSLNDRICFHYSKLLNLFPRYIGVLSDRRLNKTLNVKFNDRCLFKLLDYGPHLRKRAKTFEVKEPETIKWIDSFHLNDKFLDVGANIGVFSLYAASRGVQVISLEPEAMNYALLNIHIRINNFNQIIKAYPLALHDRSKLGILNLKRFQWGSAGNSFNKPLNEWGDSFNPVFQQGMISLTLDNFTSQLNSPINHIKIDVDGNEHLILDGASETLSSQCLKSVLIELNKEQIDYSSIVNNFASHGFSLSYIGADSSCGSIQNHIFTR